MSEAYSRDWPFDQDFELAGDRSPEASFEDDFWAHYPRREKKRDALKAWMALKPDAALCATIREHLKTRPWPREKRFVPLPGSFIRGYRWTDEVDARGQQLTGGPANRWHESDQHGGLVVGGHQWCDHLPRCKTDLDHIRLVISEREASGPRPGM